MAAIQSTEGLQGLIHRWNRRSRLRQTVYWLPQSLLPGLGIGMLLFIAARLRPLPLTALQLLLLSVGLALVGLLTMLAISWLRPRPVLNSARRYDLEFDLDERLSTALELIEGRIQSSETFFSRQIDDALIRGQAVDTREAMPLASDRRAWIALGIAVLAVLILFLLPNPQAAVDLPATTRPAAFDEAEDTVERITEEIAADTSLSDEDRQDLLQQLEQTSEILDQEDVSAEEAFATLSDTEAELQEQAEAINEQIRRQQQALDSAAQELAPDQQAQSSQEQQDAAGENLAEMLESVQAEETPPENAEALANNLDAAAAALEDTNPDLAEAMRQAAEALRNGDQQTSQEALQNAREALQQQQQQMQQQQDTAQQLQQNSQALDQASDNVAQQSSQESLLPSQGQNQPQDAPQQQGNQQGQTSQSGEAPGQPADSVQPGSGEADQGQGNLPPGVESSQQDSSTAGTGAGDQAGNEGQDETSIQQGASEPDNNPDGVGERGYSPVYSPRRPGGDGGPEIILEPDAGDTAVSEGNFAENPDGQSLVPYNEVFTEYSNAANRALDSDYIPLGLRDVVHDYFASLEPGQGR